jgi:5-methylcytosine-specific restriction enzyme A
MSNYAVIVQNDESPWDDIKGDLYHYPSTYQGILTPGCNVVYYKGRMTDKAYASERLSAGPHYFGIGVIGDSILDPNSAKKDRYCEILGYQEFAKAVPFKIDGMYLEEIPPTKESNYWRFGVREITRRIFDSIRAHATLSGYTPKLPHPNGDFESYEATEGFQKKRYTTYYERNPFYRAKAIEIHGLNCMVCGINFQTKYGDLGAGFIHVHHNKPVSETGPTRINPTTDMSVVCPNCHAMIHRGKTQALSINDLKQLFKTRTKDRAEAT